MPGRRLSWPVIAAIAVCVAWLGSANDFSERLEYELADAGARSLLRKVDSDVVIIGIDAKSLAELRHWPWPRQYHADLIDKLAPASPQRLFLDIDFSSPSDAEADRQLGEALARWRGEPVILPTFLQQSTGTGGGLLLTEPLPHLRRYADTASVNLEPSTDGLVRSFRATWNFEDLDVPSLPSLLHGVMSENGMEVRLDFSIDPASFTYFSYSDVLADRVAAEHFADKIVLVGATAVELGDNVAVPLHRSLPGVVVLALAYESLRNDPPVLMPRALYAVILAAWSMLLANLFCRQSWRRNVLIGTAATGVAATAWLLLYTLCAMILPSVPLLLAAAVAYLLSTLRSLEGETLRAIAFALGLRKRDALLKSIVLSSTDCIVCIDATGRIQMANPAAARLFACDPDTLIGSPVAGFIPSLLAGTSDGPAELFERLCDSIFEDNACTRDDDRLPVEISLSRVKLKDEHLYTAIVRDISERKAQQHQLQFQATHDPLTALPNRPALSARLDSLLAAAAPAQPVALMMIDLDRFKEVNDTLGHNVGDYVLYEVARRLENITRGSGFIARIGGDEFALVVDRFSTAQELTALSRELVECMRKPIHTCGFAIDVGLSIGIAVFPHDAGDAESLFKNADVAMYEAKRSGSGFEFYNASADRHSVRKLTTVTRLRQAIADDALALCFQPQVSLHSGKVESVEALLRWQDPALGRVAPDEFIALAETTDLIQPLSAWTLNAALRQAVQWRNQGTPLRIAVNLSARILQDTGFPAQMLRIMRSTGASARDFELEITESAMMIDPQRALRVIRQLAGSGILISIDDYGTGFSSLAYLRDLPVHALKLDKSFVMNMQHRDRVIVKSTVQLAHALNLKVVAEGVETAADAEFLRSCGYDYGQGYFYSTALEPGALLTWVRNYNLAGREHLRSAPRQLSVH